MAFRIPPSIQVVIPIRFKILVKTSSMGVSMNRQAEMSLAVQSDFFCFQVAFEKKNEFMRFNILLNYLILRSL
ncbi:MAG: hypothetical protein ACHQYP_04050 [Nitrospiria bacterium]